MSQIGIPCHAWYYAKSNLMAVALGKLAQDEQANELHKVSALLTRPKRTDVHQCEGKQSAKVFGRAHRGVVCPGGRRRLSGHFVAGWPKAGGIGLERCYGTAATQVGHVHTAGKWYFAEHPEAEVEKAGAVASADISLATDPMRAELHLHGAMEPQLRKLGMPTRLENGSIELLEEFTVCKAGDQLSADQARILKQFGHRLANSASVCSLGGAKRRDLNRLTEGHNEFNG
ncbi:hypothetical protein niasHT_022083 [Heterodera trifolii]|uniref:Large ribosomal subunit protein uL10-like insertion domain-containing protein n=1 Tax=Heterodera trifolii TaxID=157864 RepID=A0ABD2JEG4_9BILA